MKLPFTKFKAFHLNRWPRRAWRSARRRLAPSRAIAVGTALAYFLSLFPGGVTAWAEMPAYFRVRNPNPNDLNRSVLYSPAQLKAYEGTPVLPTPTFLRLKAGLIESAPTQLARMGNELERQQLASELESLLAIRKDVAGLKEGAVKGDFIEDPTGYQILGQVLAGLTPAGLAADGRDVIANAGKVIKTSGRENKLMLAMSAIGLVPLAGDGAKLAAKSLTREAAKEVDEAALVVRKALEEAPSVFKHADEAVAALRAEGLMIPGAKATLKGGMLVLEVSDEAGAALAKNPEQLQALTRFAQSKGVGRISLSVSGPRAKEVLKDLNGFNAIGAESLGRMRVEAGEELAWALRDRDKAKATYFIAQKESNRLISDAETALKTSDGKVLFAKGKRDELTALTDRWKSKGVSDSEYERGVEQIMGESGFVREGDTFVERGAKEIDQGSPSGLPESGGSLGRDGRLHPKDDGHIPQGHRVSGQGDSPRGSKPGDFETDIERIERVGRASRLESRASRLVDSKISELEGKNGLLRQELGELRGGKAANLSGEETARRGAGEARKRAMARFEDLKLVESRAKVVGELEEAGLVRVSVEVDWTKGDLPEVMGSLRDETRATGIPHKWMGGLDPYGAHSGISRPPMGVVKSATAEAGELPGEITVYSAREQLSIAKNYQKVDSKRVANNARTTRFWGALYTAEDPATAAAEVMGKAGGSKPTALNVYRINLNKARVLDLTDPKVAKEFGYEGLAQMGDKGKAYPISQSVAQKARAMGYDVIKAPSVKDGKINWNVIDNFDELVKKPTKMDRVIDIRTTTNPKFANVIAEAERRLAEKSPTAAATTKLIVMGLGGGLLLGAGARTARAGMAGNENPTAVERSGKTMATLGLGTVVDRLSKVDVGAAIEKTQKVFSAIVDVGQTAAQSVGSWGTNLANDVGTILQAQGENMTTRDAPPQTSSRPPTLSTPDTTPLPTLTITPQKGTEYTNSLTVEAVSSLLGPMPTTPSEVVAAGWDALPVPFKAQAIQVASAMGFDAYGEGRDYHVVGSSQQGHGGRVWKSIANTFSTMTGAVRAFFVNSFLKVADWLTGRSAQGLTLKGGELYAREGTKPVKLQIASGGAIEVMAGEGGKIGKLEQGKIVLGEGLTVNGVPVLSGTMTMKGGTGRIESLRLPMEKVGAMDVPGGVYHLDGGGKGWLELPGQSLGLPGGTLTLAAESVTSHDVGLGMAYIGGVGTWVSPERENFSFVRALSIGGNAGGILLNKGGDLFVATDGKMESVTAIAERIQKNAKGAVADLFAVKAVEGRVASVFGRLGVDKPTDKASEETKEARLEASRDVATAKNWAELGDSGQWELAALMSGGRMDLSRWEMRVADLERGEKRLTKAETLLRQVEGALTEKGLIRTELQEVKGKGEGLFRAGIREVMKSGFSETREVLKSKAAWAESVVERGVDFAQAEREVRNDISEPVGNGWLKRLAQWPGFLMEKAIVKGIDLTEDLDAMSAAGDMDAKITQAFNVFRIAKWGYDKTAELNDQPTWVRVSSVGFGLVGRGMLEVVNWVVPVVRLAGVTSVVVEHHTTTTALAFGMEKEEAQQWGGWAGLGSGILLFAGTASATTQANAFLNPTIRGAVGQAARTFTLGSGKEFAQALGITTGIVGAVESGVEWGGKALGWSRLEMDDGKDVGFMVAGTLVSGVLRNRADQQRALAKEKLNLAMKEELKANRLSNELRMNTDKWIESVMSKGGVIPEGKTQYNGRFYTKLETKTPEGMIEHSGRLYKAIGDGKQPSNPRLLENLLSKGGLNANTRGNSQLAQVEDLGILLQRARAGGGRFERAGREVRDTGTEVRDTGTEVRDTGTEVRDTGTEVRRRNERVQRYRDEAGEANKRAIQLEKMAGYFENADMPEGWDPLYSRLMLPRMATNLDSGARAKNLLQEAQSIINAAWDQKTNSQRSAPRDPLLR